MCFIVIGVATNAGAMATTRIFRGANSQANDCVNPINPAFPAL
jgi:hypothetical protein